MGSSSAPIAQGTLDNLKNPESRRPSDPHRLCIRDAHVWTQNRLIRGSILIQDGIIRKIARRVCESTDEHVEARGLVALPGLIDGHAHLRDMKLSYKEDFASGTRAAAAGGFTTVFDMPNTVPPTDSDQRIEEKARRASRRILVNLGMHAAAVDNPNTVKSIARAGAFSIKLYIPKPIAPLDVDNDQTILRVLRTARHENIMVTVHAESAADFEQEKPRSFLDAIRLRPDIAETSAVNRILKIQKLAGSRVHFCHISLPSSIKAIKNLHLKQLSSEVTPHHTLLSSQSVRRLGWKAWMVPPLRSPRVRNTLFQVMAKGDVTILATDHAPHTVPEKRRTPGKSLPGIPGLETALPLMLTMVNKGKLSLRRMVSLLAINPSKVFGLSSKGQLEQGKDADIVLVDIKKRGVIRPEKFFSKAHYSPFEGWKTEGAVDTTIVNGQIVYQNGKIVGRPGVGRVLRAGRL